VGRPLGSRSTLMKIDYDVIGRLAGVRGDTARRYAQRRLYDPRDLDSLLSWVNRRRAAPERTFLARACRFPIPHFGVFAHAPSNCEILPTEHRDGCGAATIAAKRRQATVPPPLGPQAISPFFGPGTHGLDRGRYVVIPVRVLSRIQLKSREPPSWRVCLESRRLNRRHVGPL
jgi:hypothetical protein